MATGRPKVKLGIDVGGTFIDLVARDREGSLRSAKVLGSATDLVGAVRAGLERLLAEAGIEPTDVTEVVHATTLGSNAMLERSGPDVALLTTRGFRDVLQIQRSLRFRMYDIQIEKPRPLVPRSRVWEVDERCLADGSVLLPLDEERVRAVARDLGEAGVVAAAVAYMHSYANPTHERRTRELLAQEFPELDVTISSDVSLQGREYERTNTAVANAYLQPVLGSYLRELVASLRDLGVAAPVWIMQSSGGLTPIQRAATMPVHTVESGPAAGALMAARHGGLSGHDDVISFDMGGTTAKAAVIREGRPATTRTFELERAELRRGSGLPLDIPAIDLVEISGGGGTIAQARLGVLGVGPRSAGADPGPACYDRGGTQPTVTDADLLLGYLNAGWFAGGTMTLATEKAERALAELGRELGLAPLRTAWGVHEVVGLEMERAIRLVSIDRGLDPRDFALVCIGGAAPVHGSRLGRSLGVRRVIVPPAAGVGSALGLLEANESLELARTRLLRLDRGDAREQVGETFARLEEEARTLVGSAWSMTQVAVHRAAGLRYRGQGYELEVPVPDDAADLEALAESFHGQYERAYGYRETQPVEGVTWYLTLVRHGSDHAKGGRAHATDGRSAAAIEGTRDAYFPETGVVSTPVHNRLALRPGDELEGPALVEEAHTTTVVLPGDRLQVDEQLALVIEVGCAA